MTSKNPLFISPHQWKKFCTYLLSKNRYILNNEWDNFIKTILFTAKKRERILKKGGPWHRARIGKKEDKWRIDINPLPPQEIKAPPNKKACEGRINPRGISYLYLANDVKTAISEVRPWLKESVTVGFFDLIRDLNFVDASQDKHMSFFFKKIPTNEPSEKWEQHVWGDINHSFSVPITTREEHIYYVPTQYLSECFKNAGYDGIIYKSSLTEDGYNIALFTPKNAVLNHARLFDIKSIAYEFEESANPYKVKAT